MFVWSRVQPKARPSCIPIRKLTRLFMPSLSILLGLKKAVERSTITASDGKRENEMKTNWRTEPSRDIKQFT